MVQRQIELHFNSGRLILINQNAIQFASAPFIRIGDETFMLTTKDPRAVEGVDDVPALKNYYHPPVSEKQVSISLATPLLEMTYKLKKASLTRRMISPLLSGNNQALMPIGVEEYEIKNPTNKAQEITLVIPRPSLVNLQEKELKPTDQDSVYICSAPIKGHVHEDYGAALSLTFSLEPGAVINIPFAVALDFPEQRYMDGKIFERKYVRSFENKETRAVDMAKTALEFYPEWLKRTLSIQSMIFNQILESPSYQNDKDGALRLTRLILNEFSFPLSNAAVWVEDKNGNERARFLECFDYSYINPSDVDWYSMVLLILFPEIEQRMCQRFIDSILAEDLSERYYHFHSSFVEARKHLRDHPDQYEDVSMVQIRDTFKIKGSVAHDLGMMPKGHPLRNVSDYSWYNNNYWVDLFPT